MGEHTESATPEEISQPHKTSDVELLKEAMPEAIGEDMLEDAEVVTAHQERFELGLRLGEVQKRLSEAELSAVQIQRVVDQFRAELAVKEMDIFEKIINFRQIRSIRKDLGTKLAELESVGAEQAAFSKQLSELEEIHKAKKEVQEIVAKNFLDVRGPDEAIEKRKAELEEIRDARDVAKTAEREGCVFVHMIPSYHFEEVADLVAAESSDKSCSTLREGSKDATWNNIDSKFQMGLLISQGSVRKARNMDHADTGQDRGQMTPNTVKSREDMIRAIQDTVPGYHNELFTEEVQFNGVFIKLPDGWEYFYDEDKGLEDGESIAEGEVTGQYLADKYDVPYYALMGNKFYHFGPMIQGGDGKVRLTLNSRPLTFEQVRSQPAVSQEIKEKVRAELRESIAE